VLNDSLLLHKTTQSSASKQAARRESTKVSLKQRQTRRKQKYIKEYLYFDEAVSSEAFLCYYSA